MPAEYLPGMSEFDRLNLKLQEMARGINFLADLIEEMQDEGILVYQLGEGEQKSIDYIVYLAKEILR